ncbi:NAD(P)/FAD-dependent oxidoreductase [Nakamurella lactea]|uniref:NAD(P)/FAD-dependent oxidoreductase n=1 Tax=Nakamurella lactea TaxID=459515 RepID=UPI00042910BB|nr:FAD-dependent oxidoreductase [Nakamurella lactea]
MTHRIVVIGAGYAGLPAVKRLARQLRHEQVTVTLVSAFADFVERPRLHQLAVGQPIAHTPLVDYLDRSNVLLLVASVTGIDPAARLLHTTDPSGRRHTVGYDTLVYALGSNIELSTVPGVAEHCIGLTGVAAALDLRARLTRLARHGGSVAVAGGGLTGIETVAEIAESYPGVRTKLVTRGVAGGWLSAQARGYLADVFARLDVTVVEHATVEHAEAGRWVLAGHRSVPFDIGVWAGGFTVPTLARESGLTVHDDGRAVVDETFASVSHPDIFVIGDAAAVAGPWGEQLAMGCRTGGFTGLPASNAIVAKLTGRPPKPFRYRYIHECISLGRRHGLVQFMDANGFPVDRILTGRKAILYKNATLNGAKLLFRHPGPVIPRRRRPLSHELTVRPVLAAVDPPVR